MAAAPAAQDSAQGIALAMRDFVNTRAPEEAQVEPFMKQIGGYATLFGLVVAISDNLHSQLVRRVLARLFDASPAGRARLCSPEVGAYLLAGLQDGQLKHVKLLTLQQTHLFILDEQGQERLLQADLFDRLLLLLEGDDVDVTEEVTVLLRALGGTARGLERFFAPRTLATLFGGVLDGDAASRPQVVDEAAQGEDLLQPFARVLRSDAERVNSIILLRVLTLLTHIACGTPLPASAATAAVAPASAPAASKEVPLELRQRGWDLFQSRGLFALLLRLASIAPASEDGPAPDMLVQLNALELLEEIVAACPRMDEAFASRLAGQIVEPALDSIERNAKAGGAVAGEGLPSLIPTASFVTVGVLRVFNKLAAVSADRAAHGWYRQRGFLLFLSAAAQAYDDESVQAEALNLLASLSSFAEGLTFFYSFESSLPATAVAEPARAAQYSSASYAAETTGVLLLQLPYFVHGSSYSNGLRQLAAIHGLAQILSQQYPDEIPSEASAAAASATAASGSSPAPAPTQMLRHLFAHLSSYHRGKAPLDVLLMLAKQPFEDVREAVWKLVLALTKHSWGISLLLHTAGFLEYLLDRKTEFHVSGMRAKFDVIRAIDASPFLNAANVAAPVRAQLHEYVRQGAHYAPLTVGVMAPVANFK